MDSNDSCTDEERRLATESLNNPVVCELLESNGITKDAFVAGKRKKHLEMFMFNYPRLDGLHLFESLTSLMIIQQDVDTITNLHRCTQLEKLWLAENRITAIQGLQNFINLKELFLYSNQITKIEGLEGCKNLEVLWLNDNKIRVIEGLDCLSSLRSLWLARNEIDVIGSSLDNNPNLSELNLSANAIGNFKDIPNLQRLVNLRVLSFSDPLYGDNPICRLGNYQTFTLYHLPQITCLDSCAITDEARHLADATFVKKKMYYNMRIKTMKRNAAVVSKLALQKRNALVSELTLGLNILMRAKNDLIKACVDSSVNSFFKLENLELISDVDGDEYPVPDANDERMVRIQAYVSGIRDRVRQVRDIDGALDAFRDRILQASSLNFNRLMVELESGGNVRLEEGRPKDVWFSSCVDLIKSRFFVNDFSSDPTLGIAGIRVSRVCRVHNRFLRNRFENRLEQITDVSDSAYKKHLEYLFIGQNLADPQELLRFAEDGVCVASDGNKTGDDAIVLTNSVSFADFRRVHMRRHSREREYRFGSFLVCKVYTGAKVVSQCCDFSPVVVSSASATSSMSTLSASLGLPDVRRQSHPGVHAVCRERAADPRQKLWYIFEDHLVLPEYLVYFEYLCGDNPEDAASLTSFDLLYKGLVASSGNTQFAASLTDPDVLDLCTYSSPFIHFSQRCSEITENIYSQDIQAECNTLLASGPQLSHPNGPEVVDLPSLSKLATVQHVGSSSLIKCLNLTGCGVKKFEVGLALSGIEVLVLSFNELAKMDFCSSMPSLRHLDLSYNLLKRIEGLDGLPALTSLLLQGNLVYRLEDVNVLKRHAPDLLHLNLRGNSITDVKNYRSIILRRLVHLRSLDGLPVTTEERLSAGERPSSITWDVLVQYARTRGPLGWSLLGRIESIDSLIPITGSAGVPSSAAEDDEGAASSPVPAVFDLSVLERVQILELTHMRIRKISNLDRLVNLRRLNFCDNEVSRIEGLDSLINLQELNLEENKITKIEGLERCLRLRKLELGKNRISRLEGVSQLRELTLFSVEDNDLNSLVGVQSLLSLMEFYAGNNKISFSRDVAVLKDLPKLIILDLSGNNMCSADADYRLFTIYTLRKLKVLDGVSIDANESQRAKEMFAGRLSTEMLAERLGHTSFGSVTELNLSASSIRDGLNVLEDFVSLRELVLDSNNISDLEPICCLKNLQVLRLARNKIEAGLSSYSAGKCIVGRQLECFHQLEILDLSYNAISYLPALHLHRLTKLRSLLLAGNEIVKVEGLDNLVQLRELILDKNKIRQIDPASFASLINLRELRLEENAIRALDNFRPLVRLQSLNISCNRIMELQEIDKLVDLRSLLEIVMVFNAVARKPMYRPHLLRRLPSLQMIDGREVTYEERERADALYSAQEYNASAAASTGYVGSQSGIQAPMGGYGSMPTAPPAPVNMGYGGLGPQGVPSYLSGPVGVQAQLGVQQSSGQQKLLVKMQSGSMEPDSGNYSQRGSSGPYRLQRGTSADASRVEPTSVPFQVQQPPPAATAGSASVLVVRRAKSNTRNAREGSFRRPR